MSLVDCPECQNQIASKAYVCPNCGLPIARHPVCERLDFYLLRLAGGLVGAIIVVMLLVPRTPTTLCIVLFAGGLSATLMLNPFWLQYIERRGKKEP